MKIITEKDTIILEQLVEKYGAERLIVEFNLKRDYRPALVAGGIALAGALGANKLANMAQEPYVYSDSAHQETVDDTPNNPYNMSDEDYELFQEKVDAVNEEINRVFDLNHISSEDLGFSPEELVYQCYLHNFDLPLAMAQLHVESHYGTTPRAKRTNSMFSIGSYDSGTDRSTYTSQNDSIEPYIIIMKRDYLQDGKKSVLDILKNGCFVNHLGKRYASNKNYERDIRNTRREIINRHPVLAKPFSTINITEGFFYDRSSGKMVRKKLFS